MNIGFEQGPGRSRITKTRDIFRGKVTLLLKIRFNRTSRVKGIDITDRSADGGTRSENLPGERHVVEVEHGGPVLEDGIDVELLDVGDVGHRVLTQMQVPNML